MDDQTQDANEIVGEAADNILPPLPTENRPNPDLPELPGLPLTPEQQKEAERQKLELEKQAEIEAQKELIQREKMEKEKEQKRKEREEELERKREEEQRRKERERRRQREAEFDDEDDYDRPRRKKRRGILRFLFNCRCMGCGCALLIVGLVAMVAFVLISRPPQIINPVKDWLNSGLESVEHDGTSLEGASIELSRQVQDFKVGENELVVTESQLRPIVNERLAQLQVVDINVDIEDGELKLFWDATPYEDATLWVVLKFQPNANENPELTYIGTERLPVPGLLNEAATRIVLTALNAATENHHL